jgi:hypothetical protein
MKHTGAIDCILNKGIALAKYFVAGLEKIHRMRYTTFPLAPGGVGR